MLQLVKVATNRPPTDNAHTMNPEPVDPIAKKDKTEENSSMGFEIKINK